MTSKVEVEIDTYSGRTNPRFMLTGPDAARVIQRIHKLHQPSTRYTAPPDRLGPRGYILRFDGKTVRVFGSAVFQDSRVYEDTEGLEDFLVKKARAAAPK